MSEVSAAAEVPIGDLRPHPRNPRTISDVRFDHLKRTLTAEREMLQARPLIARRDGTVIAGNQRLAAAQALGWESIPVVYADIDDEQAEKWMLLDNRGFGEDDVELLAGMLRDLDARGTDLAEAGYLEDDVAAILLAAQPKRTADPDAVPEPPAVPKSERGVVYELGPHRIMCGDATDAQQVAELMGGEHATLLFTSPPYLDLREYGGMQDLDPEHLASFITAWSDWAKLIAINLGLIIRDGAVLPHWDVYIAAAQTAGLKMLSWNVWNREDATSMAAQRMMFPLWHEWVFVFGAGSVTPNRVLPTKNAGSTPTRAQRLPDGSMTPSRTYLVADHKPLGTVLTSPSHKGPTDGGHPAVFPVALPLAYVESVTQCGDGVADPFAGSGSTLIACELTGRRCYAMEIDPGYCDVIRQRYADYTDQPDLAP